MTRISYINKPNMAEDAEEDPTLFLTWNWFQGSEPHDIALRSIL